jgi:hypothetical protein
VKLGADLQPGMITPISENYEHSVHKIHAFYQHFARPENDQSLFALCTRTHPRLPPPHRDIQGSGPVVYFLCMNVIGISMFMLKPKGMYIMNEFLYYEDEHRANENMECVLDFFCLFIMLFYVLTRNIMTFQTSLQKNLLDFVTTVCALHLESQFNS